ncbi:MAG: hypothetical protein Greene07144_702 [Parcubacteria group bacterium Greene0714_4]|nr:MAG: hypothetical protein Greene101415_83 [Parcubacteria group bacterium Greene1014_15]TSD07830.1 MAG: hypothetical protein Greene07144_702 [Parcubacteria group bacterium Greene0714_4]
MVGDIFWNMNVLENGRAHFHYIFILGAPVSFFAQVRRRG